MGANIQSNPSLRAPVTIANLIVRREAQLARMEPRTESHSGNNRPGMWAWEVCKRPFPHPAWPATLFTVPSVPSHRTHTWSPPLAQVWTLSRNTPPHPPLALLELRQNTPEARELEALQQETGIILVRSWRRVEKALPDRSTSKRNREDLMFQVVHLRNVKAVREFYSAPSRPDWHLLLCLSHSCLLD